MSPQRVLHGPGRFTFVKVLAERTLQGRVHMAKDLITNQFAVVKETSKELVQKGISSIALPIAEDYDKERKIHSFLSTKKDAHIG